MGLKKSYLCLSSGITMYSLTPPETMYISSTSLLPVSYHSHCIAEMQTILKIVEQTQQTGLEETCKEELLALCYLAFF